MRRLKRRRVAQHERRHRKAVDRIIKTKVKHNLSHKKLCEFVGMHYNDFEAEKIIKLVRKDLSKDSYFAHRLHGCAGCEDFMWLQSESQVCPNCNNMDGRYLFSV